VIWCARLIYESATFSEADALFNCAIDAALNALPRIG